MKKIIILLGLLLIVLLLFISINSLSSKESDSKNLTNTHTSDPDEFIVGAYHIGCTDSNRLQELGLNIWHKFSDRRTISIPGYNQTNFPHGVSDSDSLFSNISGYQSDVADYYNERTQLNNNYLYLTRPKIDMLSFAQRSDYHPFIISIGQQSTKGKWWYGYNEIDTTAGKDTTDDGKNVRYSRAGVHNSGYVVKGLRATWEQVKGPVPNDLFEDKIYSWYIKPKVRINPNVNDTTKIFRVDIIRKDETVLDSIIIRRINFNLDSLYQGGYYIDVFFPSGSNPLYIFDGADLYGNPDYPNPSQVDYRIFWYGNCDMWLEHVRVENDWAYRLFSDFYLQPEQPWIQWETENIAENSLIKNRVYKFLIDESDYNMYPAIEYLNQKINLFKSSGSKLSLIALNNIAYTTPEQRPCSTDTIPLSVIKQDFVNSGMNEVFTDIYPLYANGYSFSQFDRYEYVPNTLPVSGYSVGCGRLAISVEPQLYEDNFNANLDNLSSANNFHYIDFLKIVNELTRTYNVPHIAAIQIHSWYNGAPSSYSLREPTNEEIEVLAGIAITYGAKGIIYHAYNSIGNLGTGNMYSRGLVGNLYDNINNQCNDPVRDSNAYEQPKWKKIIDLTAKLKKLGKDIVNFDNTQT